MDLEIKKNVSLKNLSTFSIGGLCKFYICIKSIEDLKKAFSFIKENKLSYFVLGNGSNLLFDDKGFDGVILHIRIEDLAFENNKVYVGGGVLLPKLSLITAKNELSGLEYFSGIPASVGGAICMNAGAEGKSISSFLENVTFVHEDGKVQIFDKNELEFDYRFSSFNELKGAIVFATFALKAAKKVEEARLAYLTKKNKSQPIKSYSAGCVFKNPKNNFAGMCIEKCGLKGKSIGGAKVSELHANFIINEKDATSKDVLDLIDHIKKEVWERCSIELEEEIRYVTCRGRDCDGV